VESGPAAVELGLLDELAEPDALLDRALEVADGFAALPRAASQAAVATATRWGPAGTPWWRRP